MKIFDMHIHVGNDTRAEDVIAFLNSAGIDKAAILGVDHGHAGVLRKTKVYDDSLLRIVSESCGRIVGISAISAETEGDKAAIFEKALDRGLLGLKLYPHSGFYPDDERLNEVYEIASERNAPVLIHTGIKAQIYQRMIFNNPTRVDEVATRFPNLKIIIMHAGYPWLNEALCVSRLNPNVYIDLTFLDVLEYTFEEGLLESVVKRFSRVLGAEKIVWGSEGEHLDLPAYRDDGIDRVKKCIEKILGFNFLKETEKENILYNNAARLLGL